MTTVPQSTVIRRFLAAALGLPILFTLAGVLVHLWARPDLPDPIAIHWGAGGRPDGFGSPTSTLVLTVVLAIGLPALMTAFALPSLHRGDRGPSFRFLAAVMAATSALIVTLTTWLTVMQRGLTDAHDAGTVWWALADATVNAVLAGALAWWIQPDQQQVGTTERAVTPLSVTPGERLVWFRDTTIRRHWAVAAAALGVAMTILAIAFWFTGDRSAAIALTVAAVVTVLAIATTTAFHVRVDATGLTVRSWLGLPRFQVRIGDVDQASVVDINGIGDFGGFGVRWMPGRFGVVLRTGEALQVQRRSGKVFAVTVDDAATAAATLNALAG